MNVLIEALQMNSPLTGGSPCPAKHTRMMLASSAINLVSALIVKDF